MGARAASVATVAWLHCYTRCVGPEAGSRRRGEVGSDVFEQQASGGGSRAIAYRLLTGVPADLAWVRSERRRETSVVPGPDLAWAYGVGLVAAFLAAATAVLLTQDGRPHAEQAFVIGPAVVCLVAALLVRYAAPPVAAALVLVGVLPCVLAAWLPGLLGLVALLAVGAAARLGGLTIVGAGHRAAGAVATAVLVVAVTLPSVGWWEQWPALLGVALAAAVTLLLLSTRSRRLV